MQFGSNTEDDGDYQGTDESQLTNFSTYSSNGQANLDNEGQQPTKQSRINISWSAAQFINHQHSSRWYIATTLIVGLIIAGVVVLKLIGAMDWFSLISTCLLIVVMYVALLVFANRPQRQSNYSLTNQGITVDERLRTFSEFRAFGVRQMNGLWQLVLIPVKRLGLEVSMFIDESQGEQIVDILGSILPMEEVKPDIVDKILEALKI